MLMICGPPKLPLAHMSRSATMTRAAMTRAAIRTVLVLGSLSPSSTRTSRAMAIILLATGFGPPC